MKDELIIDPLLDIFIENLHKKYPEAEIVMDKRKDNYGIQYLYLIGLSIKKEYRKTGLATQIIKDISKYADDQCMEVHAWACNVFGTDLNTWIPFLEEMGFKRMDKDNNLIYFPK